LQGITLNIGLKTPYFGLKYSAFLRKVRRATEKMFAKQKACTKMDLTDKNRIKFKELIIITVENCNLIITILHKE